MFLFGEYVYGITIPPIGGIPLKDLDFDVTTYTYVNREVTFHKGDERVKFKDDNTCHIIIDLESALKVGRGTILARITIHVPNSDFKDGFQTIILDGIKTGWEF